MSEVLEAFRYPARLLVLARMEVGENISTFMLRERVSFASVSHAVRDLEAAGLLKTQRRNLDHGKVREVVWVDQQARFHAVIAVNGAMFIKDLMPKRPEPPPVVEVASP